MDPAKNPWGNETRGGGQRREILLRAGADFRGQPTFFRGQRPIDVLEMVRHGLVPVV